MEVTLQLDDQVVQAIQKRAKDRGVTVAAQLEQTVREVYLPAANNKQASPKTGKLPSHGHGGLRPGVNLDNSAALADLLDGFDAAARR
jgi:hypothetical protein